jgi:hypothetical protein
MATPTETTRFIDRLDTLSTKYLNIDKQLDRSLDGLYDVLRRIQVRANKLEDKPKLRERVLDEIGRRKNRSLLLTIVIRVIKAKSKDDRKKASKYARVLEYLAQVERKEPADIPKAIKLAGGIECLARKAAEALPKTKRCTTGQSAGIDKDSKISSGGYQTSRVIISTSSNQNRELSGVPLDRKVNLLCRRVEGAKDGIGLKIMKIVPEDSPSDWI